MKILSLRLSNLASLAGEQYIDFESEPLANAGLIAITGKTGAGKSTLLDAMCLALFDQIPRLQGASGHLSDPNGEVIQLKNSKHILRRGCVTGFAEVEFVALDQKRYKARWELSRTRKKVDGKFKLDRAVICLDDARIMTQKITECTPCIQQLIGLSFEQFTRAILLAQSDVGAFLKAKDQERADLLEYLTNSSIFSVVSQCAFEKTKGFKQELDKFQDYIGHIELLSTQEIDHLTDTQHKQQQQIQEQQQQIKQLEYATQWYVQHHQLQKQQYTLQQQYVTLETQQTSYEQKRQRVLELEQFSQVQHHIEAIHTTQLKQQQLQQQREHHLTSFKHIEYDVQQQLQLCTDAEQQSQQQEQRLSQLQPVLEQGFALDATRQQLLNHYQQQETQQQKLEQQLQSEQQQYKLLQEKLNELTQQQHDIDHTQQQLKDFLALAEEPRANLDKLEQLQQLWQRLQKAKCTDLDDFEQRTQLLAQHVEELTNKHGSLDTLTEHSVSQQQRQYQHQQTQQQLQYLLKNIDHQLEQELKLDQINTTCTQYQHDLEQLEQDLKQHESAYQHAEEALTQTQQRLAEQQLLHADHIKQLRSKLKPDQACMVCGSTEHPFIQHQHILEESLAQLHTQHEQTYIVAKEHALQQWQNSQKKHTQRHLEINHLKSQRTEYQHLIQQLKAQILRDLHNLNLNTHADKDNTAQLKTYCQQHVKTLDAQQQSIAQQQTKLKQQQEQLKIKQQQLTEQRQTAVIIEQFKTLKTNILTLLGSSQQQAWHDTPNQAIQQTIQAIQMLNDSKNQQQQLQTQRDQQQHKCTLLAQQQHTTQQQYEQLCHDKNHTKEQGVEIALTLKNLLAQHGENQLKTTMQWHQQLQTQLNHAKQTFHTAQQQLTEKQQHYHTKKSELDAINQELQLWQQHEQTHQIAQEGWQKQFPHFTTALIKTCLSYTSTDLQQLREDLQQFEQDKMTLETQIKHVTTQLDQHLQQQPAYLEADLAPLTAQHLNTLKSIQEEKNQIHSRLLLNTQAQQQHHTYLTQIKKLQDQVNRWGKISELIGSKEGTKFQRIAQEHHLDILVEYANQQLAPLSQRYELQRIQNSLGLAIIDHDMNSEVRPVLSLSGGETFLVSLALALALANMASGEMKLESLFIDEGFGTLDPSSLHIVMDALDRLQSQGRKVVLISHVQEMHERIPVQIQVKAMGSGASQVHIIG
ncbi:AAA family ATPase [Acinetobacter sp. B5B]|uniref:AAA family ATPase n=1 Tax=Acinetobacter baretiae TaxID=2605383 RepID=UPI0018C34390|nr:AAA family ATPase [Acinetobacter baretiae]MBF7683509.1 AAA family ATPase [Acinetobacter baretiae]